MTMYNFALALWLVPMVFLIGVAVGFYKFRLIPWTVFAGLLISALIPGLNCINAFTLFTYKVPNEDK